MIVLSLLNLIISLTYIIIDTKNNVLICCFRGSASSLSALMDMPHQVRVVELLLMNSKVLQHVF